MKRFFDRSLLIALALVLALTPVLAQAQEAQAPITHYGVATVALKVRRAPTQESTGGDSIAKGAYVYIVEYGEEWCKVRTSALEGYVMTKYLDNIKEYDAAAVQTQQEAAPAQEAEAQMPQFTTSKENFREGYYAYALKPAVMYQEPRDNSRKLASVSTYEQVIVSEVSGDWCLARYKNRTYGYIKCDRLFMWDRIDPYAGEIPGLDVMPLLAFVNKTTIIYSMKNNSELKKINPGAAIAVFEKDELGRYRLPYWREYGYVREEDVAYTMPVADWENAQSGDLLSTMSTYFAVGISTLQYQGRNWNIRLSGSMITGTVLQPGEEYNQRQTIGPFMKSTGYHKAPIMKTGALWGYGGGTCQTNTTFYITTIQLPLLVTHRKVHSKSGIYYAKMGFDAAVGGNDINLIMTNTLPYAIRYQYFISDGVLTCCIFKA